MKRQMLVLALGGVVLAGGCEWTGTSEGESWNDAYSWVDFSGVYRAADGASPIVTGGSSSGSSAYVKTESSGSTSDGVFNYSGTVSQAPIVAGSVTVRIGNVVAFSDNGAGALAQVGGTGVGSISYATGAWAVAANGVLVPGGQTITVTYQVAATSGTAIPGNSGSAVYHITVDQTGNLLGLTDSRGKAFSGKITGSSGASDPTVPGSVRLVFDATSADGSVRIKGSFTGDWSGATLNPDGVTASGGVLVNRQLEGTWIENKIQDNINAISGPYAIPSVSVSYSVTAP